MPIAHATGCFGWKVVYSVRSFRRYSISNGEIKCKKYTSQGKKFDLPQIEKRLQNDIFVEHTISIRNWIRIGREIRKENGLLMTFIQEFEKLQLINSIVLSFGENGGLTRKWKPNDKNTKKEETIRLFVWLLCVKSH